MDEEPFDADRRKQEELISYFALKPQEFAWQDARIRDIQKRRAAMSGSLFFDKLLELGGIEDTAKLYPPRNLKAVLRLCEAVDSATYDMMKRDCLIYYLLKCHTDGKGREKEFANDRCISPHYVALADVFWYLDAGVDLGKAICLFSDARIVKDYTSKILHTLALAENSGPLIRKFVRTCRPALREPEDLVFYLVALADYSVIEAWQYQRTFAGNDDLRKRLIENLIGWTLNPQPRQDALKQLISLPFSEYEESVVRKFALEPPAELPAKSTTVLRDMVCVRLIQTCKYADAVKLDRQFYGTASTGSGGAAKGTWEAERKRIIDGVLSIMPPVERAQLERELGGIGSVLGTATQIPPSPLPNGQSSTNISASMSTDLSMSWEEIGGSLSRRKSFNKPKSSKAPYGNRMSLGNGALPRTLFTPGASTSAGSPRAPLPLSAHPTLVSQSSSAAMTSGLSTHPTLTSISASAANANSNIQSTPVRATVFPSAPLSDGLNTGSPAITNGTTGTQKRNAFVARNAFFNPPETASRDQEQNFSALSATKSNGKTLSAANGHRPKSIAKATTPPPEARVTELISPARSLSPASSPKEQLYIDVENVTMSVDGEAGEQSVTSEQEHDLGYSIFGGSTSAYRPSASSPKKNVRPKKERKSRTVSEEEPTKIPGAFISDDDEGFHSLRSRRSSSIQKNTPAPSKRNTRKRAASPDESPETTRINVPRILLEDGDEGDKSRDAGDETGEEADIVPPLAKSGRGAGRISAASSKGSAGRTRRMSRSRGSSIEPSDVGEESIKPVRRSSRLSTVSGPSSPVEMQKKSTANGRPRKSTRTAKDGATATGKGATKRR